MIVNGYRSMKGALACPVHGLAWRAGSVHGALVEAAAAVGW